jgi:predicted ribosome quality control (RQC) complex YloA/Tae2 family protein
LFSNWLTYRSVAAELDVRLRDAIVRAAFTQQKNELVMVLEHEGEELVLQFSAEPRAAWLLIKPEFARARRNSLDLFPDLLGDRIVSVSIATSDRIMRIALGSGRMLYVFLFAMRANLLLCGEDGEEIDNFKQSQLPADYRALTYDNTPPRWTREDIDASAAETAGGSGLALLRALRPWLTGALAQEILYRSGIDTSIECAAWSENDYARLLASLNAVVDESALGKGHLYRHDDTPLHVAPVTLAHLQSKSTKHEEDGILELLFFSLRLRFSGGELAAVRKRVLDRVVKEIVRLERTKGKLSSPAALRKQADEYEKFGNLLMIHLYDQPEQPGRMTVPDVFTDMRLVVSIPLKARSTVLENAQRYFGKAQQTRASIMYVEERGARIAERLALLTDVRARVENADSLNELKQVLKEQAKLMSELGLTPKGEKDEAPFPFRRFVVEGGFEVWAGRNSANNDLLTVRHSRPNDLWFHARGVGGSHVVLKVGSAAGDPSKEAIRQAASIAAYYSKHRNAKRAPVAYTEKKYVRKPRGAAPGSVLVDREKVILADPALPQDVD